MTGEGKATTPARIGPASKLAALRDQPDQIYPFVIRQTGPALPATLLPADVGPVTPLPIIGGFAARIRVAAAFALAADARVSQVWYLHPDLAPLCLRVMQALDWNMANLPLPAIANLSLGPPPRFWPPQPEPEDPIHAATRAAAEAGLIPVIAIGNAGEGPGDRRGLVNPWCLPPWVIAVGAHDGAAGRIAGFSSRGDPARPATWPDVVAQGVDMIVPHPTHLPKSPDRRARDEGNAAFIARVAPDDRDSHTLDQGTSQAAAVVSAAAQQVLFFLRETILRAQARRGAPLFELTAPPGRASPTGRALPRLTGSAEVRPDGSTRFHYTLDEPWKMVKQLLIDTALPLPDVPPEAGGAGLVDPALIRAQFGAYGLVTPRIAASKVIE